MKLKKTLYKMWSKFLTAFGDIKIFRWPFWLVYDPDDFMVTGDKVLEIMDILKPGDIILRGYNRYLDGKFINVFGISTDKTAIGGDWSHGALYVGDRKIIHAVAEGVQQVDVIDFTRCDRICIFRPSRMQDEAVKKAHTFLDSSIPYDFSFEHGASSLYCFELAALCYDKLDIPTFNVKKLFGLINKKDIYVAQSFVDSKDLELIFCFNPKHSIDFRKLGI